MIARRLLLRRSSPIGVPSGWCARFSPVWLAPSCSASKWREAKRRRFFEAVGRAFLGDGLPWNWSIWKGHFPTFTPILDFIHVLSYLFLAAKAVHQKAEDAWDQYVVWMARLLAGGCGRQVLEELRQWQIRLGEPPQGAPENDPRQIVARTITYLGNNLTRMDYPGYRRQGLPVTTAWMESLVKELNYRVKGTERFWNDPEGAEAILQVRAAALRDDDLTGLPSPDPPRLPIHSSPQNPQNDKCELQKLTCTRTSCSFCFNQDIPLFESGIDPPVRICGFCATRALAEITPLPNPSPSQPRPERPSKDALLASIPSPKSLVAHLDQLLIG